ncbi:Integrator complex subunit 3 [Rhynchospora pubera]|uniref:Integrator complex subunit 3 n=1 Tax=Rhynchospora pubera TaxID=906938 RepID=A0AAV8HS41_9POAL|nr:Integrator complex subunit 3 [Rhynchospora pubera]
MTVPTNPLLHYNPYEAKHQLDLSLAKAYLLLHSQLKPPFPLTIPSPSEYALLTQALAFSLLTQPDLTKINLKHLHASATDGYDIFTTTLLNLTDNCYPKLLPVPRTQLLFLCSQLINVAAFKVDSLVISLLRRINGGDFTEPNLWLCAELAKILSDNWDWLIDEPLVLTSALFVFLRLLADHYRLVSGPQLDELKRLEISFCIRVLRNCFHLCLGIGRDLIRLLQDLFVIPEFKELWKDLICDPCKFGVLGFSDLCDIYRIKTPRHYFLLRISQEMEAQLRFLLTHVKWVNQQRYQVWFAKKYLSLPGSETVIVDVIRFICQCYHPSKEIIQSNVISRWAVIGWLLKSCKRNYFEANAKLALFYDWLFFNDTIDSIMDIEPAMLLIVSSVPQYMEITHCLLEFLFLVVDNYDVQRKNVIAKGVLGAFNALVKRGVVHSLEVLMNCDKLSPFLREKLSKFLFDKALVSQEKEIIQMQSGDHQDQIAGMPEQAHQWL